LSNTPTPLVVKIPSLAFVVKLGQKKAEYRKAAELKAIENSNDSKQNQQIVETSSENSIDDDYAIKLTINNLPDEIIREVLSFFTGTTPGPGLEDIRKVSPEALQKENDSWCMKQKRESVKWLRVSREVCKWWRVIGSSLITGIKLSDMFETTLSCSHNNSVKKIVLEFPNVTTLNLRHSENLTNIKVIDGFEGGGRRLRR